MEGLLIPNMDPRYAEVEWLHSLDQRSQRFNYPPLAIPNSDFDKNMSQSLNNQSDIYPITFDDDDDLHFPSQTVNQLDYQYPPIITSSNIHYPLPLNSSTTFQFRPHPLIDFPNYNSLPTCNDAVLDPVTFKDVTGTVTTTKLPALEESSKTSTWLKRDVDKHHQDLKFEMEMNDVGLDGNLVVKSENCSHRDNVDQLASPVDESLKFNFDDQHGSRIHELGLGQYGNSTMDVAIQGNYNGKRLVENLEFAELQKYFEMPIAVAANRLNVGLTVLKKRCRALNIRRWPHRKIKSLKALIHNVKEMGLVKEVEMLEENARMIKDMPELDLPDRTKKLRQHCFKANYKKRRTTFT